MKKYFFLLFFLLITSNINAQTYSWQKPHAKVLPNGDLEWAPETFVYTAGSSVRYIDFENGNDANSGTDTLTAWKHHPWDTAAKSNALACTGIHTYVFKRGVIYRGYLHAKNSGQADNPIRLTSNPAWGTGDACIFGSTRISGGWTQCDPSSAPKIPNPDKVWYYDLPSTMPSTKMVAEIISNNILRVPLARTPNWNYSDEMDPMSEWWTWTGVVGHGTASGYRIDTVHLKQTDPTYWVGGQVWSEYNGIMGTMWGEKIISFDPATRSLKTTSNQGGAACRYYIENLPQLLDSNEFYFDKSGAFPNRLYIRLSNDRNPNTTILEVADKGMLMTIWNQQNIEISGLSFAFTTYDKIHFTSTGDVYNMAAVINIKENCQNIKISHCKFNYINAGITLMNAPDPLQNCNHITISDNEMNHIDDQAITCSSNSHDYLNHIFILRNKIHDNGGRQLCRGYSFIPAIGGSFRIAEIAGNIIDFSWGSGINISWGKGNGDSSRAVPLIRGMVHHNRSDRTLLGLNDYGGIESWQGGPAYFFNNYSKRARGYHKSAGNQTSNPWGFPYYFDGAFKQYCFNNIAVGPANSMTDATKRYRAAFMEVLGFHNMLANNTAHNFYYGVTAQGHSGSTPGYNQYLGNVFDNVSKQYFLCPDLPESLIPHESYGFNVFSGTPELFGSYSVLGTVNTIEDFQTSMKSKNAMLSQTGWVSQIPVLTNAAANNFAPVAGSSVVDHGVKFFAPLSLYSVVGEWHFYRFLDYTKVPGSNFYFTEEYGARADYLNQPKNHLTAVGLGQSNYVRGTLEDWTDGALRFDGSTTYAFLTDAVIKAKTATNLDMSKENFTIEAVISTAKGHTNGVVAAKYSAGGNGYALDIDPTGHARIRIRIAGTDVYSRSSEKIVNDSIWHHLVVEVDRKKWLATWYIDGKLSNGTHTGEMPEVAESLSNTGDFLVGKSIDEQFYRGNIDFLRVSKGLLADAGTSIEELYAWEFDGPFLKDFLGNKPQGKRDAGAIEVGKRTCTLNVTPSTLSFIEFKDSKTVMISPADEFSYNLSDSWITATENKGLLTLTVVKTNSTQPRTGYLTVFGCYDTIVIPLVQAGNPRLIKLNNAEDGITIYPNPVVNDLYLSNPVMRIVDFSMMNSQGQIMMRKKTSASEEIINMSSFSPGLYFLKITVDTEEKTFKIIKQ